MQLAQHIDITNKSTSPNMTTACYLMSDNTFPEIKQQGSTFLGESFSVRNITVTSVNVTSAIEFRPHLTTEPTKLFLKK